MSSLHEDAINVRVSTNDQTTENQLPDLEAQASRRGFGRHNPRAALHRGLRREKRPALNRMMADAKKDRLQGPSPPHSRTSAAC
ncbi:MAG: recombinase family protein [Labilithrix sp.]|nr:recombinase family protein [Labilithrix sp.]